MTSLQTYLQESEEKPYIIGSLSIRALLLMLNSVGMAFSLHIYVTSFTHVSALTSFSPKKTLFNIQS